MDVTMRATDRAAYTASHFDDIDAQQHLAEKTNNKANQSLADMDANATVMGLYRTFNNDGYLARNLSKLQVGATNFIGVGKKPDGSKAFGMGQLLIQFPRTPANILQRVIDYSPAGIIPTVMNIRRAETDYLKQKVGVEGISRSMVGTSLVVGGAWLASKGFITGGEPDDPEEKKKWQLQRDYGLQPYAVNFTALSRYIQSGFKDEEAGILRAGDTLHTYDWIEPTSVPIAIGADFMLQQNDIESLSDIDAGKIFSSATKATVKGIETFEGQPVLTGITNFLKYKSLSQAGLSMLYDIPASFTPSILGHIASVGEGANKDAYTSYTAEERMATQVMNKIPVVKSKLPDRYTTFGDKKMYTPEGESLAKNIFRNIFNTAFFDEYHPSKEVQFVLDLYDKSGDIGVIPPASKPQTSYRIDGIDYDISPHEREELAEWIGNEINSYVSRSFGYMSNLTTEQQVEEMKDIIKIVNNATRDRVVRTIKPVENKKKK